MSLADALRGLREEPDPEIGTQVPKHPSSEAPKSGAQVPKSLSTEAPKSIALPLQGTAKSKHPDYGAYKVYLRTKTQKAAARKAEDVDEIDFSELCERLLVDYLRT